MRKDVRRVFLSVIVSNLLLPLTCGNFTALAEDPVPAKEAPAQDSSPANESAPAGKTAPANEMALAGKTVSTEQAEEAAPLGTRPVAGDGGTYWGVNFPPSTAPNELIYAADWRIWIPDGAEPLRGVIVHQHGCGDGSSKPGKDAVADWHWQALARKYHCALTAVSYRQTGACELWCDPRNGSAKSFLNALEFFAETTRRPELTTIPWIIWGHSGGGHWTGSMCQLYPERIVCAWLRSGHPDTVGDDFAELPTTDELREIPMVLNLGVREKTEFKRIWDKGFPYLLAMRRHGAKISILLDPTTGHCCGDSRYPAIRFFDVCMAQRLPEKAGSAEIRPMKTGLIVSAEEIFAEYEKIPDIGQNKENGAEMVGDLLKPYLAEGFWLPDDAFKKTWQSFQTDAVWEDETPPPAPFDVKVVWSDEPTEKETGILRKKATVTWKAYADLESGLKSFIIESDGKEIAELQGPNSVGRPVFQGLKYSDTPNSLNKENSFAQIVEIPENSGEASAISVRSVNALGMKSSATVAK